jgi:rubrerythrin
MIKMASSDAVWYSMSKEDRKKELIQRRLDNQTFEQIAKDLLGSPKKKSTIWSWAQRNMDNNEIYPALRALTPQPFKKFGEVEQWIMYDVLQYLFPRLDAMTEHLLTEVQKTLDKQDKLRADQKAKFEKTAGFLDNLEQRIMSSIQRNLQSVQIQTSSAPTPPRSMVGGAPPPPPPPGSAMLPTSTVPSGPMAALRTDFEDMSMEEITALPPDFLEALTPVDRGRIQNRVKELKMIEKMSPEEREEYLRKKEEEKARSEAAEGLGSSLTAMLDDDDSLFARMRRSADESQVSGTGTFGKFTTEYTYIYCIACGKTNRSEEESIEECGYCYADSDHLVADDEKSNYTYHECLSHKSQEYVDLDYTRGKQIRILSRWKKPIGESTHPHKCPSDQIREITTAIMSKADPDKQFSYYLTLFRLYTQLKLQSDLKPLFGQLLVTIQKLPDSSTKEAAITDTYELMDHILAIIAWITERNVIEALPNYAEIQATIDNLVIDIDPLRDAESPQELRKSSDIGSVTSKADQLLNKFTSIILQIESEIIIPSQWKCTSCNNIFEVKDRNKTPEKCESCGKIITKLVPVD